MFWRQRLRGFESSSMVISSIAPRATAIIFFNRRLSVVENIQSMQRGRELSQKQVIYRCGRCDESSTDEKGISGKPVGNGKKVEDTPAQTEELARSTSHNAVEKKAEDQSPSADGQIWPNGPANTD